MAQQNLFFGLVWLAAACGGHAMTDSPGGSGAGATGGGVATGTAGSGGTAAGGTVAGGGAWASDDWTTCASKDTCVLETKSACGAGCEPVPISSFVAINSAYDAEYRGNGGPTPPCIETQCPDVVPGAANTPNYYAACEVGHCQVLDVRTSPLSACGSDLECWVRSGTSCCGCGSGDLIAVSTQANVEQAFCGASGGCVGDCASGPLPPGMSVACVAGHCRVAYPVVAAGVAGASGDDGGP